MRWTLCEYYLRSKTYFIEGLTALCLFLVFSPSVETVHVITRYYTNSWPECILKVSSLASVCRICLAHNPTGEPTLDSGLKITWGNGKHWKQVDDATSPRGRIWCLSRVYWLAVKAKVRAPHPGLYAAFFRIRRRTNRTPLLHFSAEWKADGAKTGKPGFLKPVTPAGNSDPLNAEGLLDLRQGHVSRQDSDAVVSWSHRKLAHKVDQRTWVLLHIGNVVVRDRIHGLQSAVAATDAAGEGDGLDVSLSFGGNNPNGCGNLDVDFAAIAPLQLSWDIARVIWIGHIKGLDGDKTSKGEGDNEEAEPPEIGICPLSRVPESVVRLLLEYSQPTLTRNVDINELDGLNDSREGTWRVF